MDEFPVLETERLTLREFRESDAQAVFDIFSQEGVSRYVNSETMQSIAEAEDKVQSRMRLFKGGHGARWAVTLKEQGDTVIGSCGFYLLNRDWL